MGELRGLELAQKLLKRLSLAGPQRLRSPRWECGGAWQCGGV